MLGPIADCAMRHVWISLNRYLPDRTIADLVICKRCGIYEEMPRPPSTQLSSAIGIPGTAVCYGSNAIGFG